MYEGSLFSTSAPTLVTCRLFDSHSDRCEVISPCFDLHFCVYWDDHVICIFPFVSHWLIWEHWTILVSLQNKSNLVMVHDPFYMLLDSICQYFVEHFCIYVHQGYWPVISFFHSVCVYFLYQGNGRLVTWIWECLNLLHFWNNLRRIGITSFLYVSLNSPVKPSSPGLLFSGFFLKSQIQFHY